MKRFWAKVEKIKGGCWMWRGAITSRSYGSFLMVDGKAWQAHRVAWHLINGAIPDGLHVLHKCDVKACVRPSHLFLGTHAENMADMVRKGKSGNCVRPKQGERNGMSKFTETIIREIRSKHARGALQDDLAKMYGTSQGHVSNIVLRKTWRHV